MISTIKGKLALVTEKILPQIQDKYFTDSTQGGYSCG
jgi:hypothetical protein